MYMQDVATASGTDLLPVRERKDMLENHENAGY